MARFRLRIAGADSNDLGQYDRLAAFVRKSGFHAMGLGSLAEITEQQMADPRDSWVRFTARNAALMKFVETELVHDVLSPSHMEKNAALLAEKSKILAKHGLKGTFRALEPMWLPESYYADHPEIRGPRVDHPGVARHRYFSPCIDLPEVLAHYREGVRKLCEMAPELLVIGLWGNDSGAGVCWCHGLYAGRNGPDRCREIPMGKRIRGWLQAMLAGAADAGTKIHVTINDHGYGRPDTLDMIANFPRRAHLAVGFSRVPNEPFINRQRELLIEACRRARRGFFMGVETTFAYPLSPLVGVPSIYFIFETIGAAARSGAEAVSAGGVGVSTDGSPLAPALAVAAALARPPGNGAQVERAAGKIARELVGPKLAPSLISAWRDLDIALRIWPNRGDYNHVFYTHYSVLGDRWLVRPIVPVPERLSDREKHYYSVHRHGSRGGDFENSFFVSESIKNLRPDEFKWPLADYEGMLLYMDRAAETLRAALETAGDDSRTAALAMQYHRIAAIKSLWRTQKNVLQCGSILEWMASERRGELMKDAATHRRLFLEGVDDEIENARELISLIGRCDETLLRTGPRESSFDLPENLAELLEKKIALMKKYRPDIDLLFPGVGDDEFLPEVYTEIDQKLTKEGK